MHVNYEYVLDRATRIVRHHAGARVLDYGCGDGTVVQAGLERALDIYGVDVFYAGANSRENVAKLGLPAGRIREIHDGRIDFPDESFDVVLSNQVFEHVQDLDAVLCEIHRVLRPEGILLALFPSRSALREGHIGIPFAHWFSRGSRLRYPYTLALRGLGFGYFKGEKSPGVWTRDALDWIDNYTVYRSEAAIMRSFSRLFDVEPMEKDYAIFRLRCARRTAWLAPVAQMGPVGRLVGWPMRMLAGMVIEAKKRSGRK